MSDKDMCTQCGRRFDTMMFGLCRECVAKQPKPVYEKPGRFVILTKDDARKRITNQDLREQVLDVFDWKGCLAVVVQVEDRVKRSYSITPIVTSDMYELAVRWQTVDERAWLTNRVPWFDINSVDATQGYVAERAMKESDVVEKQEFTTSDMDMHEEDDRRAIYTVEHSPLYAEFNTRKQAQKFVDEYGGIIIEGREDPDPNKKNNGRFFTAKQIETLRRLARNAMSDTEMAEEDLTEFPSVPVDWRCPTCKGMVRYVTTTGFVGCARGHESR